MFFYQLLRGAVVVFAGERLDEIRVVNLESSLSGLVFQPLNDPDYFRRFTIPFNTIQWENGADFAPEYLYEISIPE